MTSIVSKHHSSCLSIVDTPFTMSVVIEREHVFVWTNSKRKNSKFNHWFISISMKILNTQILRFFLYFFCFFFESLLTFLCFFSSRKRERESNATKQKCFGFLWKIRNSHTVQYRRMERKIAENRMFTPLENALYSVYVYCEFTEYKWICKFSVHTPPNFLFREDLFNLSTDQKKKSLLCCFVSFWILLYCKIVLLYILLFLVDKCIRMKNAFFSFVRTKQI